MKNLDRTLETLVLRPESIDTHTLVADSEGSLRMSLELGMKERLQWTPDEGLLQYLYGPQTRAFLFLSQETNTFPLGFHEQVITLLPP